MERVREVVVVEVVGVVEVVKVVGVVKVHHRLRHLSWPFLPLRVMTLALGSRPRRRLARVRAKRSVRKCEDEDSHSQVNSHFGSWNHGGLSNLQRIIVVVKTTCIEEFFISLESY